MQQFHRTLMVFVDGLGVPPADLPESPVRPAVCPCLCELIERHSLPIDAHMGLPGLPQSATGQTALLTGINAPQAMGCHIEGFPGPGLCRIIVEHNIFKQFLDLGLTATFANGYFLTNTAEARRLRLRSVTTVATLSAFGCVRDRDSIAANDAVCQDLTRESIRERGYEGPLLTPAEAAEHLAAIARRYHFTLFEFFQTDRAGHAGEAQAAEQVLRKLDAFLERLRPLAAADGVTLLLTSDHGNIEDLRARQHTHNAVPYATEGPDAAALAVGVAALCDVTPAIVRCHSA
jgi:2,3-bisphosphoglycerate-independent phosphoglycerate mutase